LLAIGIYFTKFFNPVEVSKPTEYKAIYKGNESSKGVAFGCNVVWGTEYVPSLLEIANENGIKLTFFLGGEWAKDNPKLVKEMVLKGHEIGNHGYNHKYHSKLTFEQNLKEIQLTEETIMEITGFKTNLFAPPYGDFNKTTLNAAESLGYKTIMWSIDTIDWQNPGPALIINRVLKNLHSGAIILIHPTEDTIKAIPELLKEIEKRGLGVKTVSQIIEGL
jgi:probable sporulation protein (polysaccharide deacetylase family)